MRLIQPAAKLLKNALNASFLLGTVMHEYMCHVYPPNETVGQEIVLTGRWKYSADIPSEQINVEQII